jgi:uncharacterized protein YlxW (UPF0749 family)
MNEMPNPDPQDTQVEEFHEPSSAGMKIAIAAVVLVAIIAVIYGFLQHNTAQQLASERADLRTALAQAKSQEDALAAKVNALSAAHAQEEAARAQAQTLMTEQFSAPANEAPRQAARSTTHYVAAHRAHVDDPHWKQFQNQLGDQQKELAESQKEIADTQANLQKTQSDLQQAKSDLQGDLKTARTELGGDIARNHTELVALEKKGERNYYEFTFEKSKTYHHAGPLSIAVHKADAKHEYCDLQMLIDDKEITRKHVDLYESVTLYPQGYPQPLEVVINRIDKDSVHGYVSEPKYRSTEQAATPAAPSTSAAVNPPAPATPGPQLQHRETQ